MTWCTGQIRVELNSRMVDDMLRYDKMVSLLIVRTTKKVTAGVDLVEEPCKTESNNAYICTSVQYTFVNVPTRMFRFYKHGRVMVSNVKKQGK